MAAKFEKSHVHSHYFPHQLGLGYSLRNGKKHTPFEMEWLVCDKVFDFSISQIYSTNWNFMSGSKASFKRSNPPGDDSDEDPTLKPNPIKRGFSGVMVGESLFAICDYTTLNSICGVSCGPVAYR